MAGIYLHIPFCESRCVYCDFFSTTGQETRRVDYVRALVRELELRRHYAEDEPVGSIYFGGGTPSILPVEDLRLIFEQIDRIFTVLPDAEITIEANPDDLTPDYLLALSGLPVDRISMGVQSFYDEDLRKLNRRHTAAQALQAVKDCREVGFENLSIDLIYGLPGQTAEEWEHNLDVALSLRVPHISAYHLTYEEGTPIYRQLLAGKVTPVSEDTSLKLFNMLTDRLRGAGYLHYEISNFCLPGAFARHNRSYWEGVKYLGVGAGAHSYNGRQRQWNVASLPLYIRGIESGQPEVTREELTAEMRYNEFVMTHLRTMWGVDLEMLAREVGEEWWSYCLRQAQPYLGANRLILTDNHLILAPDALFISDSILTDLMCV